MNKIIPKVLTAMLSGSEEMYNVKGAHCWIRNDSSEAIYASGSGGITPGSDGVVMIPAGESAPVYGANGAVYLKGTGSVQLMGSDFSDNPFRKSSSVGGSGEDGVARAAISAHASNTEAHVSAAEKAAWNAVNYSNPNLIDNPDFAINQRGAGEYSEAGFSIDRWRLNSNFGRVTVSDKVRYSCSSVSFVFTQKIEGSFAGKKLTLSACFEDAIDTRIAVYKDGFATNFGSTEVSGSGVFCTEVNVPTDYTGALNVVVRSGSSGNASGCILWAKLEEGGQTVYLPPDPTAELAKCQRYYQMRSTGNIAAVDLRPTMRATPTVTQLGDGTFAYSAEI